jgi:hypothetical protein
VHSRTCKSPDSAFPYDQIDEVDEAFRHHGVHKIESVDASDFHHLFNLVDDLRGGADEKRSGTADPDELCYLSDRPHSVYWLFNEQARLRDLADLRKRLNELRVSNPEYGAVRALYMSMMVDAERWGFIKSSSGSGGDGRER